MPEGQVLEFSGLTKRFGGITAVSGLSARVEPGRVTGFLGPNGAGKTTSLRILLGLVRATSGTATIGGAHYSALAQPTQSVGAVLESSSFHPGRSGANHLNVYAEAAGIRRARVDEVLGLVGLADAAGRKVGSYSLGMRQRLGVAAALLGDPGVLVLDEPTNGLDPEGIRWIRGFLRELAREGRTVLVSSHLLAEVQQTVDALLIISRGRLVFQGRLDELTDPGEYTTIADARDRGALSEALREAQVSFDVLRSGLTVPGLAPAEVGRIAATAGVALSALQRRGPALEEVFLELANGTRTHASASGEPLAPEAAAPEAEPEAEPEPEPEPVQDEPEPEQDVPVVPAEADETSENAETSGPAPSTAAAFAVAETGVIDIITPTETGTETTADTDTDTDTDSESETESAAADTETPAFAVAATGVIDIITADAATGDHSSDDSGEDDPGWEDYVRTDADEEADRFFAAYDDGESDGDKPAEEEEGEQR